VRRIGEEKTGKEIWGFAGMYLNVSNGSNTFDFMQGCVAFRRIKRATRHNPEK
jgi:hypothetical protein